MRAGVQEGDRIVKVSISRCHPAHGAVCPPSPACLSPALLCQVNGTMVTNSSHLEVVKLIKCEYGQGAVVAASHPVPPRRGCPIAGMPWCPWAVSGAGTGPVSPSLPCCSSRCLRRSDPPGLPPSIRGAPQFPAGRERGRGSPHHPRLSPSAASTAAASTAAHHGPQTPAGTKPLRAPAARALLRAWRTTKAKPSVALCIPPNVQDPEVQKHATQILRNMLRQEEAELQVQRRMGLLWCWPGSPRHKPGTLHPAGPGAAVGWAAWGCVSVAVLSLPAALL